MKTKPAFDEETFEKTARKKRAKASTTQACGHCICGAVEFEIDVPARWAWHDHSEASRRAQGSACVTYIGSYKSRFRILKGSENITRFDDKPRARAANRAITFISNKRRNGRIAAKSLAP